ncbi:MAG: hypothetical protein M3Z85_15300 [Acidobacteriota bacterium]|nr:hypothetical protein [Acidobacteriota bacterium]
MKIVMIVVSVLFVFGALGIAGIYYAGHRLIQHVETATGQPNLASSIRDAVSGGGTQSASRGGMLGSIQNAAARKRDGCALLSKSEVESILGTQIERIDGKPSETESGEHCDYFIKPGTMEQDEAKLRQSAEDFKAKQGAIDKLNGANLNEQARKEGVENLAKNFMRTMASSNGTGDVPFFSFSVDREQGKAQFGAFRTVNVIVGSAAKGSNETLSGLGDQALMGPMDSVLCVLKGNTCITLNLTQVPDGKTKGAALAQKILSRL